MVKKGPPLRRGGVFIFSEENSAIIA